ncbi:hypothetical protein BD779DRAFT_1487386 [Infundibulicybe gibba]|nr:hypothetical protein BD779DRAFT_1487386 [Infundibulicybe gibba]
MQTVTTPSPTLSVSSDPGTLCTLIASPFLHKRSQPIGPHFHNLPRRTRRPASARSPPSSSSSSSQSAEIANSNGTSRYVQPHITHLPRRRPLTILPASGLFIALSDDIDGELFTAFTSSASLVLTLHTTDCEQGTPQLTHSQFWDGLAFLHTHHHHALDSTRRTLITTPSSHAASGLALAVALLVLGGLGDAPCGGEGEEVVHGHYTRTHLFVMALHDLAGDTDNGGTDVLLRDGMCWVQRAVCGWQEGADIL